MKPSFSRLILLLFLFIHFQSSAQWTKETIGTNNLRCVRFVNSSSVFMSGNTGFYKSMDGGNTFATLSTPTFMSIASFWPLDSLNIVAVGSVAGNSELIAKSTDGGNSWTIVNINNAGNWPRELLAVTFPTKLIGYAVGTNGRMLKTINSGLSWSILNLPTNGDINAVHFISATTGFAVSDSSIFKTVDGGLAWFRTASVGTLKDIQFISADTGFIVGDKLILKTTDQGLIWTPKPFTGNTSSFTGIKMMNSDSGFACSDQGLFKTANKGESFHYQPTLGISQLLAIDFGSSTIGVTAGESGVKARTTSGGLPVPRNDAILSSTNLPNGNLCKGTYPVSVKIANNGMLPLVKLNIKWKVNNVIQPTIAWTGNLPFDSVSGNVFLGNYNFQNGISNLVIWTESPNGLMDNNKLNDSLYYTFNINKLGGVYTVGGISPDFTTLQDALYALVGHPLFSVCDNVTLKIRNGTHIMSSSKLYYASEDSLSRTKKILIESESGDSSKVIITGNFVNQPLFSFQGISNITFSKITLKNTGSPGVVRFINDSKNITFTHCNIQGAAVISSEVTGSIEFANNAFFDSLIFLNTTFIGGENAISINNSTASNNFYKGCFTQIENCKIDSQLYAGLFISGNCKGAIKSNTISLNLLNSLNSNITLDGIKLSHITQKFTLSNNHIQLISGYGISLFSVTAAGADSTLIVNNFIKIGNFQSNPGLNSNIGIEASHSNSLVIGHNTIIVNSSNSATAIFLLNTDTVRAYQIVNNILSSKAPTSSIYFLSYPKSVFMDGNVLYSSSRIIMANYYTVDEWATSNGGDLHSFWADPEWNTNSFQFPFNRSNYAILNKGVPYPLIATDADGELRSSTHPDPGSDEVSDPTFDVALSSLGTTMHACSGLAPVKVDVFNFGTDTLKSMTIQWTVNGISQSPFIWSGILTGRKSVIGLAIGNINRPWGSMDTIAAYIISTNGLPEPNKTNDTVSYLRKTGGISGIFTIGGTNPDYVSFNTAKADLLTKGVCGPVIFSIRPGIYTEQVIIPYINGTNQVNTITFQSENNDSSTTTLRFATTAASNFVLKFDSASYTTFKGIGIINTSLVAANPLYNIVSFINRSQHITLVRMLISGPLQSIGSSLVNQDLNAIISNCSFENSLFVGGQYAISLEPKGNSSSGYFNIGNRILFNTFKDQIALMKISNQETFELAHNQVSSTVSGNLSNLITINNTCGLLRIHHNKVIENTTGSLCIHLTSCIGLPTKKVQFYNNSLNILLLNKALNVDVLHNTIIDGFDLLSSSSVAVINNILYANNPSSPAYNSCVVGLQSCSEIWMDYNCIYNANGPTLYDIDNVKIESFSLIKKLGFDQHSFHKNPEFGSYNNPHIRPNNSGWLKNAGLNMDIADDVNSNPRNIISPDIGADEFIFQPISTDAGIVSIEIPYINCTNQTSVKVNVRNYGTDTLKSVAIHWSVNGISQTPQPITFNLPYLDTASCYLQYPFNNSTIYAVKANTQNPNNVIDTRTSNDSALIDSLHNSLNGIYSIGGANFNYAKITDAVKDLILYGVCGPVVFNINNGIYTEDITIPKITGSSPTNTITFKSTGDDSSLVTIKGTSSSNNNYTLTLNNTNNLNFEQITLSSSSGKVPVYITNNANNIRFSNCYFPYINYAEAAIKTNEHCSNLRFSNNLFRLPVEFIGYTSGIPNSYAQIITFNNNVFDNANCLSIKGYDSAITIVNNRFVNSTVSPSTSSFGISISGCSKQYVIDKNMLMGGFFNPIIIVAGGCFSTNILSTISNNIISGGCNGISINDPHRLDIVHNSLNLYPHPPTNNKVGFALNLISSNSRIRIRNNIFSIKDTSGIYIVIDPNYINFDSKYNIFNSTCKKLYYKTTTTYPFSGSYNSLSEVLVNYKQELNSIVGDPGFVNDSNLHLLNQLSRGKGAPLQNITDDFNGHPRNPNTPDVGAYEGILIPSVDLGNDTLLCSAQSFLLSNKYTNTNANYLWSNGDTLPHTFVNQSGKYWLKVVGTNGFIVDTITVTMLTTQVLFLGNDTASCDTFELKSNIAGAKYFWSTGDTLNRINVKNSNLYYLWVTDNQNCTVRDTINITIHKTPDTNLGRDTLICGNLSYQLSLPSGYGKYLWSTGDTSHSTLITLSGIYSVWASNNNQCFSYDTIAILNAAKPIVNIGKDTSVCSGKTILLDAGNPGLTYKWSTGATTKQITPTATGYYFVNVTNNSGCSNSDTLLFTLLNRPNAYFAIDSSALPKYRFTTPDNNANSYRWHFGDGDSSLLKSSEHIYVSSGTYRVSLNLLNTCGADSFIRNLTYVKKPSGVNEYLNNQRTITVYPNPSNTELIILLSHKSENAQVAIVDLLGRKTDIIVSSKTTGWTIDTSELAEGSYFLTVSDYDTAQVVKFIVLH